jgi:ABC-type branched-subunit amino acid transport system ATPase component
MTFANYQLKIKSSESFSDSLTYAERGEVVHVDAAKNLQAQPDVLNRLLGVQR